MDNVIEISSKIINVSVAKDEPIKDSSSLEVINENLDRPRVLSGKTYKIKSPLTTTSMYVTINNIVLNEGTDQEVIQPFEIFVNSRDMSSFQWVVALTRMISGIFHKGGDISFIVRELLSTYDPSGGYLSKGGRYIPSVVAELGIVLEEHLKFYGIIKESESITETREYVNSKAKENGIDLDKVKGKYCASCGHHSVIMIDGCASCIDCGSSKCG
jgi:hypothetical protein